MNISVSIGGGRPGGNRTSLAKQLLQERKGDSSFEFRSKGTSALGRHHRTKLQDGALDFDDWDVGTSRNRRNVGSFFEYLDDSAKSKSEDSRKHVSEVDYSSRSSKNKSGLREFDVDTDDMFASKTKSFLNRSGKKHFDDDDDDDLRGRGSKLHRLRSRENAAYEDEIDSKNKNLSERKRGDLAERNEGGGIVSSSKSEKKTVKKSSKSENVQRTITKDGKTTTTKEESHDSNEVKEERSDVKQFREPGSKALAVGGSAEEKSTSIVKREEKKEGKKLTEEESKGKDGRTLSKLSKLDTTKDLNQEEKKLELSTTKSFDAQTGDSATKTKKAETTTSKIAEGKKSETTKMERGADGEIIKTKGAEVTGNVKEKKHKVTDVDVEEKDASGKVAARRKAHLEAEVGQEFGGTKSKEEKNRYAIDEAGRSIKTTETKEGKSKTRKEHDKMQMQLNEEIETEDGTLKLETKEGSQGGKETTRGYSKSNIKSTPVSEAIDSVKRTVFSPNVGAGDAQDAIEAGSPARRVRQRARPAPLTKANVEAANGDVKGAKTPTTPSATSDYGTMDSSMAESMRSRDKK
ncbi:triadin [Lingula anatina]|uniref:Triadin n=1 Tax=Lingula anatina TaxID=7574 RepID=A0A1S3HYT6_LINAN|nr:triadin [Lingula anatina]|eukprot:XP_013391185.1 triadin [Lingula anatina]